MSDHDPSPAPSVFSKLEETRAMLERTLGLASLLQAYHLIQVLPVVGVALEICYHVL